MIGGRIRIGKEQWLPLMLFVVRDFRDVRMDRVTGAIPIARRRDPDRAILPRHHARERRRSRDRAHERSRRASAAHRRNRSRRGARAGMDGARRHRLRDVELRASRGADVESQQLRILVNGDRLDERHIREVAKRVELAINAKVTRIDVPTPGRHPHAAQMDTFLFLLGAFGALTFALSAVLVANMIHALLVEQLRQAAVMKTLGASTRQIASLYLGQVSILAVAALAIGIPLGISAGRAYARFCASMLNATITNAMPPLWVIAAEVVAGICVPLLVALGPVWRVSRISIHEAFSNGVGLRAFGTRAVRPMAGADRNGCRVR